MLRCRTSGFVAAETVRLYSANGHVYLWASSERDAVPNCPRDERAARQDVAPSVIYRIVANSGDVSFAKVSGVGLDQYAMHERDGTLFAFAAWPNARCDFDSVTKASSHFALLDIPPSLFSKRPLPIADEQITALPPNSGTGKAGGKFVGDWLVYASSNLGYMSPDLDEVYSDSAIAVPLQRPGDVTQLQVPHSIQMVERVDKNALLYGYRDGRGLTATFLDLSATPHFAPGLMLEGRFENRRFGDLPNSMVDAHRGALIGLPILTTEREQASSALAIISQDESGELHLNGEIAQPDARRQAEKAANGYECEVLCERAFNVRAMFIDNRIIALSGTDMVETQLDDGKLRELRRLDLTATLAP